MKTTATHTFQEDANTTWFLLEKVGSVGNRLFVLFCERNGEEVKGTRKQFKNKTKDLKELFGL